jgi:hypothetical protein
VAEPNLGWKLTWTDYTGRAEGRARILKHGRQRTAKPRAHAEVFRTRGEAEAAQARLQATGGDGFVSSVVPVTLKAPPPTPALLDDLPSMLKRLTR